MFFDTDYFAAQYFDSDYFSVIDATVPPEEIIPNSYIYFILRINDPLKINLRTGI